MARTNKKLYPHRLTKGLCIYFSRRTNICSVFKVESVRPFYSNLKRMLEKPFYIAGHVRVMDSTLSILDFTVLDTRASNGSNLPCLFTRTFYKDSCIISMPIFHYITTLICRHIQPTRKVILAADVVYLG